MTLMFAPNAPVTAADGTVVALHGSASAPSQWSHLVTSLQDDFDVVTPHLPGYGMARIAPWAKPRTLEEIARAVMDDLDDVTTGLHLVGHSFGGAVALKIASMFPNRVLSLTLIEPAAFNLVWNFFGISSPKTEGFNQAVRQSRNALKGGDNAGAMQIFMDFWNGHGFWERCRAEQRDKMAGFGAQIHDDFVALVSDRFTPADAISVMCPVLCISGSHSPVEIREITAILSQHIVQFQHQVVADAGHMVPVTHPDVVNPMIGAFLAKSSCDCQKYKCAA